jgi:hypothetical protein
MGLVKTGKSTEKCKTTDEALLVWFKQASSLNAPANHRFLL